MPMKPIEVGMRVTESGAIGFAVNRPSKVEDAIWEAVEQAIEAGWTPRQFKLEVASAWEQRFR